MAAEKALSLDPDLAEAHTAVAVLASMGEWDWDRAEQSFQRAIELDPSYTWAYYTYARQLSHQGRFEEARLQLQQARRIDPVSVSPTGVDLGYVYVLMGDLESAAAAWQDALDLAPEDYRVHRHLGNHLCRTGSFERGIEELEWALSKMPGEDRILADLGYCHALAGNAEAARDHLRQIEANAENRYVDPVHSALVHLGLGEVDRAFELLQHAYEIGSPVVCEVATDLRYVGLREDPRFAELLRGMGLYGLLPPPKG